jgi:FkbM family methyltransferase
MRMSKWMYYATSIPTLLGGVKSWGAIARLPFHKASSQPIRVELRDGCQFLVRSLMDLWIVKETCLDRIYEESPLLLGKDSVMVDIGAGLGDFTVHIACTYPGCRVYAYEPFAESFRLLEQNLALNDMTGGVQAFPLAIGARSGPMRLQTATGVAVRHSTAASGEASGSPATIRVDGLSLDDAFRRLGFSRCGLLKVDCEGGEYDIFFHASPGTLKKIGRIAMEYHDGMTEHSHGELVAFLTRHGFSVRTRPNPVHGNIGMLFADRSP